MLTKGRNYLAKYTTKTVEQSGNMELESLIGSNLIKADGSEIKSEDLSTNTGAVLGLYFSAHWCPPCRKFTPKLAEVYENLKKSSQDFEVVFISSDSTPEKKQE